MNKLKNFSFVIIFQLLIGVSAYAGSTDLGGGGTSLKSRFISQSLSILNYLDQTKQSAVDTKFLRGILKDKRLKIIVVDHLTSPVDGKVIQGNEGSPEAWGSFLFIQLTKDFKFIPTEVFHELLRASSVYGPKDENYEITIMKLHLDEVSFVIDAEEINMNPYSIESIKSYKVSLGKSNKFSLYELIYFGEFGLDDDKNKLSYSELGELIQKNQASVLNRFNQLDKLSQMLLKSVLYKAISCLASINSDEVIMNLYLVRSPIPGNMIKYMKKNIIFTNTKCRQSDSQLGLNFEFLGFKSKLSQLILYKKMYLEFLKKEYAMLATIIKNSLKEWGYLEEFYSEYYNDDYCLEDDDDIELINLAICAQLKLNVLNMAELMGISSHLRQRLAFDLMSADEGYNHKNIPEILEFYKDYIFYQEFIQ